MYSYTTSIKCTCSAYRVRGVYMGYTQSRGSIMDLYHNEATGFKLSLQKVAEVL